MTERELISEIGGIARLAATFEEAVGRMEAILAREIGSATLLPRPVQNGSPFLASTGIARFLESREFPFRGIYTAPLAPGDSPRGTLVACFGTWGAPGETLQRITACVAEQLSPLHCRGPRRAKAA